MCSAYGRVQPLLCLRCFYDKNECYDEMPVGFVLRCCAERVQPLVADAYAIAGAVPFSVPASSGSGTRQDSADSRSR